MAPWCSSLIVNLITWDRTREDSRCFAAPVVVAERCKEKGILLRGGIQSQVLHVLWSNTLTHTHTDVHTNTPLSVPESLRQKRKLGESWANQNQRQPCLKSCTPLRRNHPGQSRARSSSRWCFFDVILMGMNRSGSNKSKGADHARCGEYGKEWMGFKFLLCLRYFIPLFKTGYLISFHAA